MKASFRNLMNFSTTYLLFIIVGLAMVVTAFIKLIGIIDFSSDWFWFIAGFALIIEGTVLFKKQRLFDQKYKVVRREGAE